MVGVAGHERGRICRNSALLRVAATSRSRTVAVLRPIYVRELFDAGAFQIEREVCHAFSAHTQRVVGARARNPRKPFAGARVVDRR